MGNQVYTEQDYALVLDDIFDGVATLRKLEEELKQLFPERDFLIRQLVLAVLMRANVLIYGKYGTAKSLLINQFIKGLGAADDELFSIEMTRFTTESDLFGPIDIPLLREQGEQRRNPAGTLRRAIYANIGEMFDAPQSLRLLLGVLNERYYSRGPDSEAVPLHSAIASTNIDPKDLIKRYPDSDAVVDRFPFQCEVHWLDNDDSLRTMFLGFLRGQKPTSQVDHDKLLKAAGLVTAPTDQIGEEMIEPFVNIVKVVRTQGQQNDWRRISDRAFTLWLTVLEASAILNERYKVNAADLHMLRYVICNGGNEEQLQIFDSHIVPIIEKAIEEQGAMSVDDAVTIAINAIRQDWPAPPDSNTGAQELVELRRKFGQHIKTSHTMQPQLPATAAKVRRLQEEINDQISRIDALIAQV